MDAHTHYSLQQGPIDKHPEHFYETKKGTFKESQVDRMTAAQYEANEEAITNSIRNGTFIYDISGAAR